MRSDPLFSGQSFFVFFFNNVFKIYVRFSSFITLIEVHGSKLLTVVNGCKEKKGVIVLKIIYIVFISFRVFCLHI